MTSVGEMKGVKGEESGFTSHIPGVVLGRIYLVGGMCSLSSQAVPNRLVSDHNFINCQSITPS